MALIILSPGEQSDIVIGTGGGFGNTVRAATGNELATIAANGVAEFDSSWTDGDTIRVLGDASEFTVEVSSSDLIFTSTSGGSFSVPIKATGATLVFDDASRQISVKDGDVCLGDQIIEGPAEAVDEGSNGSGGGGGGGGDGQTFLLDFTTDFLNGTDGDDTFNAPLSQNSTGSGEQANRLGTGDTLNGGGGNDQLLAVVQDASALNGAPSSPIAPFTVDIETAIFTAIAPTNYFESDTDYDYEDYTVEINAGAMIGLDVIGSGGYSPFPGLPAILNSDASLIIYNLTTLTDSGEYDDRRPTEELCIVMDHTGNGDQLLPAADLIVLFDQDYLFCDPNAPSGSQLFIEMMDLDAAIDLQTDDGVDNHGVGQGQTYQGPLDQVPFTQLTFDLDTDGDGVADETRTLDFGAYGDILSYEDLRDAVNQAIADAGPDYVNFTAVLQGQFIANDTDAQPGGSAVGDILVITNSGPETLLGGTLVATEVADGDRDFHNEVYPTPPGEEDCKIAVDIKLEKVGRGGDGGALIVGGMSGNFEYNVWGAGSGEARGIEQFNITVLGDETQPSSLANVKSTNNILQCIIIEDEGDEKASLTIGNSQTEYCGFDPCFPYDDNGYIIRKSLISYDNYGYYGEDCNPCDLSTFKNNALKDVLVFDASKFDNDTEVHGYFSREVQPKYLDARDDDPTTGAPPPAATEDNSYGNAQYLFGNGNDLLNMNIDQSNMAVIGSATREDFSFSASTGGGDDHVQIQLGSGYSFEPWRVEEDLPAVAEWYHNHVLNQNLHIDTGEGDDFVETWGSTAAYIDLGTGDDVVFTDNSGGECGECDSPTGTEYNHGNATWTFNTLIESQDVEVDEEGVVTGFDHGEDFIGNLASAKAGAVSGVANLGLRVTFQGIESNLVEVGETNGTIGGETVTDLDINQAIKLAINEHPVLSAVLVAEDGPARTLVVRSLIDGMHSEVDVDIDSDGVVTATAGDLTIELAATGPLTAAQSNAGAKLLGDLDPDALASIGFNTDGSALLAPTVDAAGNVVAQPRYDADFADGYCMEEIYGTDSWNVNNNVVMGDLGDDVIVLSSNGVGYSQGASVETIDIDGVFDDDTIFNFTAADGEVSIPEVQCIAVTEMIPDMSASGSASIYLDFPSNEGSIPDLSVFLTWDETTTAQDIAQEIVDDINASLSSYVTASISEDDDTKVIITYDGSNLEPGANWDEIIVGMPSGFPLTDDPVEQTLTFSEIQEDDGDVEITFNGVVVTVSVGDGNSLTDPADIAEAFQMAFDGNTGITATVSGGVLVLTAPDGDPGAVNINYLGFSEQVTLNIVTEQTAGPGPSVILAPDTVTNGSDPEPGYDIFDVDDLLNADVKTTTNFHNDMQSDGTEAAALQGGSDYDVDELSIVLIDTVEQNDYAFSQNYSGPNAERNRIEEILNDADDGGPAMSLVITVNADNVGTFYKVTNGAGSGDVTVDRVGSVELATYVDDIKDPIGNWDLMSISNFVDLTPGQLTDTFST